nr:integrase, catalytic region, zinc finger, CCHC-type, peptidase aspartic, catalytic [Tanacetum cinerariifolium]
MENLPKIGKTNALSKSVTLNSVSTPQESEENTKTRRPQPRSNTKNDRVPSASKSSRSQNKEAEVEEHHRNLLLSKNNKHISSASNNIKIDSQDVISKVVCAMCKLVDSSESKSQYDCSNGDNACISNAMEPKIKLFPNSTSLLDRSGLPKFKYHEEHLCPSCEQGKSKRASHPPKPIPNSRQRLQLLHMDLCGPMRVTSINDKRKPDISFLHVFGALCYPKNDREDIGKLGAKGDIGFFIGYSADSYAYRVYNRQTKKIMKTMNVSFDELLAMAFEQRNSKPEL